jgi:hypothetical protein
MKKFAWDVLSQEIQRAAKRVQTTEPAVQSRAILPRALAAVRLHKLAKLIWRQAGDRGHESAAAASV